MYKNIVIQAIRKPLFKNREVSVDVLRLDLMHPFISGNKWFKLKYHIQEALQLGKKGIVTFGGAYSNHLTATAVACSDHHLKSIGIIRGEETLPLNPSITQMKEAGMEIVYVSRNEYRDKEALAKRFEEEGYLYVPEGGQSAAGMKGASEILSYTDNNYTHIISAVGTGTTLAGLSLAANALQQVLGICVLKIDPNENDISAFIASSANTSNYSINYNYHFGGYAKRNDHLIGFMNDLYLDENIPTDFVYTGKMFFAVYDLLLQNHFSAGSRLLLIHTGGLQGNRSLPPGTLVF